MKNVIAILAVLSLAAFAGQIAIDPGPTQATDGDLLTYDNGTLHWLMSGGGNYRGVWFNLEDFVPGATGCGINSLEFWFYHHASHPWDTDEVYLELWNGTADAPTVQLNQTMVTALHRAPVFLTFATPEEVEANFWVISNTELSAEGLPSSLCDWAGSAIPHSFSSEDLIIWEPLAIDDLNCNWFYRADATFDQAFDNLTWGSLKATF